MKIIVKLVIVLFILTSPAACVSRGFGKKDYATVEATGYCKCQECCGWKRNLLMQPVYAYGSMEGERKKLGITASGSKAKPGRTIAADTSIFPFGTKLKVPGYGTGTVEDRGGAIKGARLDLFFRTHKQALEWGRQTVTVEIIRE
ncbi:3D domain-containing protein [Verrucomicrobiales bacterium]|nr:3D domain-containing protein [Verrucomicrobiales bacterium]